MAYRHSIPGLSASIRDQMYASVAGGSNWDQSHSGFYGYQGASKRSGTGSPYASNTLQAAWHRAGEHFGYQHGGTLNRKRLAMLVSEGGPAPSAPAAPPPPPPPPPKPPHIDTSKSPPAVKAPVSNINNDPAYKALQAKLASMTSQYTGLQGQYSGLQGQFSGLKGQYAAMNNNLQIISGQLKTSQDKEKAYAKAEQDRIDQLAAENAFGKTTNQQVGGVKTKKSLAMQQGLTSRGTSGSFGRSGLRIKNLNI